MGAASFCGACEAKDKADSLARRDTPKKFKIYNLKQ